MVVVRVVHVVDDEIVQNDVAPRIISFSSYFSLTMMKLSTSLSNNGQDTVTVHTHPEKKDYCVELAKSQALKSGAGAALTTGLTVMLANHFSKSFRTGLGLSGKLAFVVMGTLGTYAIKLEHVVHDAQVHPDRYFAINNEGGLRHLEPQERVHEQNSSKVLPWLASHPLESFLLLASPGIASVAVLKPSNPRPLQGLALAAAFLGTAGARFVAGN